MLSSNPRKEVEVVLWLKRASIINCKYVNIPIKVCVLNIINRYTVAQLN